MAQNKIVIAPNTTTVTVSSVGLNGPAGADGAEAFPYTGSAIISGSLDITGSLYVSGTILTTQITASVVHSGSNYLIASPVSGDTNETIILTGSVYDNVSMVKVTHQRGSNGTFTVQLPDATAGNSINRTIRFISDSTVDNIHQIDISPSGSQTLDGGGGFTMNRGYEGIMVWSDGTEWFKIQAKNV